MPSFLYRHLFWSPPRPTTSFTEKIIIVTGANTGLGKEATKSLVRLGAKVIMGVRNMQKGEAAAQDIRASTSCTPESLIVWEVDMNSYASVRQFAQKVETELPRVDALLANAGVHYDTWNVTEGNEEQLTTNVISTALLCCLLFPKLRKTAIEYKTETHISITTSDLYSRAKFIEHSAPEGQLIATLNNKQKSDITDRYNVTKLLEIYVVKEMAKAMPYDAHHVIVSCVAPGFCHSDLTRLKNTVGMKVLKALLARPTDVGARTLVHTISAGASTHGQYVEDGLRVVPTIGYAGGEKSRQTQQRFWAELKQILESIQPGVTYL